MAVLVDAFRLLSGPIALVLALWLLRRGPGRDPLRSVRDDWDSSNQVEHWEGVRRLARDTRVLLYETIAKSDVTVADQNNLRAAVDSLDLQVSTYAELWENGSFYSSERQWRRTPRSGFDGPSWATPLFDRIGFAAWWLSNHDPLSFEKSPGWY